MPVYEFYCENCHMIFNFLSKRINTKDTPICPKCKNKNMKRKVSIFSVISSSKKEDDNGEMDDPISKMLSQVDEKKLESAIASLADQADKIDEDNPKEMAKLMKKLFETTGLKMGGAMEEALRRLEAGEDPEKIEEEMGDLFEDENSLFDLKKTKISKLLPPKEDETLYNMDDYIVNETK